MGRYDRHVGTDIQPRHLMLVIALACRKFRDKPIRATWQNLGSGLGVRADTLRRWAYELRDLELLEIKPTTRSDARNGPNEFDLAPFVELLQEADECWRQSEVARKGREATQ